MNSNTFLILCHDEGWRVLPCGEEVPTGLDTPQDICRDTTSLVSNLLKRGTNKGALSVVIARPGHLCYAARVSAAGLPSRQLRQALAYRFEPLIPFSIEEMATDICGHGEDRFIVATSLASLEPAVRALEDAGIQVCAISPLALLAAQHLRFNTSDADGADPPQVVRVTEAVSASSEIQHAFNEITFSSDQLVQWRWQPKEPAGDHNEDALVYDVASTLQHACLAAQAVAAEDLQPCINLQQGSLANRQKIEQVRRPLTACLMAAAFLLLAGVIAMQVRAWQYRTLASSHDQQAQSLYQSAFPHEAIPGSMQRRLKTKLRDVRGRQGLASEDTQLYTNQNTLAILHDLLERLPKDFRLIITDLRINENRIDINGQTRSHSDADTLAQALRADGRFIVTPPSTENLSGQGVQFSLNLTYPRKLVGGDSRSLVAGASHESSARTIGESGNGGTP